MQIKSVRLINFRNYQEVLLNLSPCKTILIGENAQGKTNFLESIEFAAHGKTSRATKDIELVSWGQKFLQVEVCIHRNNFEHLVLITLNHSLATGGLEKKIKINGINKLSRRELSKALVTVGFKSQDLNLLRGGGPKFRRDWIDSIAYSIQPHYHDVLSSYNKVLAQRNRYLKDLAQHGALSVSSQDQLTVWNKQLAKFGARIIWQRCRLLEELLPRASKHHSNISGNRETLSATYCFRAPQQITNDNEESDEVLTPTPTIHQAEEAEIFHHLLQLMKESRSEEIWRKQSLIGPHRDDITFELNQVSATAFASQGQQRSLVLSLKLAELERVAEQLDDYPILLLDDVLAELDIARQNFLLAAIPKEMQTIITTTHITSFEPHWLENAGILEVADGEIIVSKQENITMLPI